MAILYITHRLNEVPEIADEVVIFRDGNLIVQGPVAEFDRQRIVEAMTGEALKGFEHDEVSAEKGHTEAPVLELSNASILPIFSNISFELYKGEIVSLSAEWAAARWKSAKRYSVCVPSIAARLTCSVSTGNQRRPSTPKSAASVLFRSTAKHKGYYRVSHPGRT